MTTPWHGMADQVLSGLPLSEAQALSVLESPDDQLLDLLSAAFRVRQAAFGKTVQLYVLMNVRSGLCPEDCGYCSQSRVSTAPISKYPLLPDAQILEAAETAARWGACTFCMVASGRGPADHEVRRIAGLVESIKSRYPVKICACLGLLSQEQANLLGQAGVNRVNHNLNTSESHYPEICSTHSFADRVETLDKVRLAGIDRCSGCIIGIGETPADLVWTARRLREMDVVSIPINFLHPIDGTPFAGTWNLTPQYCLKVLCMFRFVNPTTEIRAAGGRELHLGSLQPLALYPANSIFLGDYLTTSGQAVESDLKMIRELGFTVVPQPDNPISGTPQPGGPMPGVRPMAVPASEIGCAEANGSEPGRSMGLVTPA